MENKTTAIIPVNSYVSLETDADLIKRKNLYLLNAGLTFVWIVFHFSAVFFFGLKLQSVALVGIFLGIGNLVSFLLDIPIGVLQRYFSPRKLFLSGGFAILIASLIFLKFAFDLPINTSGGIINGVITFLTKDLVNIVLLIVASVLYGFTKEINEVTMLSYVLNNSDPSEYADIISKNNIYG